MVPFHRQYPAKREQVLRDGTDSERKSIFAFSDSLQLLGCDGFDITVGGTPLVRSNSSIREGSSGGTALVRSGSNSSFREGSSGGTALVRSGSNSSMRRSNSVGRIVSYGDEGETAIGLQDINALLDEVLDCTTASPQCRHARPARPAVAAIDRGRHEADAFGMMCFHVVSASSQASQQLVVQPSVSVATSSHSYCMDRIVRQIKEASEKPLSASRGSLQRSLTKANKRGTKRGKPLRKKRRRQRKRPSPLLQR